MTYSEARRQIKALANIVRDEDSGSVPAKASAIRGALNLCDKLETFDIVGINEVDCTTWETVVLRWASKVRGLELSTRVEVYDDETFDAFFEHQPSGGKYRVYRVSDFNGWDDTSTDVQ